MKGTWDFDRDPLSALRRGDPTLFEEFVRCEAQSFLGFFRRLGADTFEAEDLAQEVFLKLYKSAHTYTEQSAFGAFAMRVARNAWIDRRRRRAARPERRTGPAEERGGRADGPHDAVDAGSARSREPDPPGVASDREEFARLQRALGRLSEPHRVVFEMAVMHECPYADIARALGIPIGTVKSRVFNALRRLREALQEEPESRCRSPHE